MKASPPGAGLGTTAESALLALAMHGNAAAFSEIVRRRQSWVRNLLRRLCRDPSLADDLAQQTFLQAWRSLHSLKTAAAFAAWLRKLALNTWLQHLRAAQGSTGRLAPEMPEPATTVPVGVRLDLDRALAQLREPVRLCVVLAYHEGLSHGEIGTITELPLGTVKSHIKRGAEQLRSLLYAYNPQQGDQDER